MRKVFLSYNRADRDAVEALANRLRKEQDIDPWLDTWNLVPGQPWMPEIEAAIAQCHCCAIIIGKSEAANGGLGPWQVAEMGGFITRQMEDPAARFPVIPVLLPGAERAQRSSLPKFLVANTWVEFRRSLDEDAAFARLLAGIRDQRPGAPNDGQILSTENPYRGLEFFDVGHVDQFFGREAATQWLVDDLRKLLKAGSHLPRFLALIGASGSGKTSLARAGLYAGLRQDALEGSKDWIFVPPVRPGHDPIESLEVALLKAAAGSPQLETVRAELGSLATEPQNLHRAARLLVSDANPRLFLLVDQFEEVFTLCGNEEKRRAFMDALLHAAREPGGPVVIAFTMRADFYPKIAPYESLARVVDQHQFLIGPMNERELRQAIEEPVLRAGAEFEPGLVEALLDEVKHQPGSLPLLQHALKELWHRRENGRRLTHDAYKAIGRIEGALERQAKEVFGQFNTGEQELCRRIFLRLVHPGEGTEDTRRRVSLGELAGLGERSEIERIVGRLASPDARLLVTEGSGNQTGGYAEVAHEALIRTWSQLRRWIDADRSGLRVHRRLTEASREWAENGRKTEFLYAGTRLAVAREWAAKNAGELSSLEQEFLDASAQHEAATAANALAKERERVEALERLNLEQAQRIADRKKADAKTRKLAVAAAVLFILALFFLVSSRIKHQQTRHAQATNEVLLGQIRLAGTTNGALLAQIRSAGDSNKVLLAQIRLEQDRSQLDAGKTWLLRAQAALERREILDALLFAGQAVGFVGYGRDLGSTNAADSPTLLGGHFDSDPRMEAERRESEAAAHQLVATVEPKILPIWRSPRLQHHSEPVGSVAFNSNGTRLASGSDDKTIKLWDVTTGKQLATFSGHQRSVQSLAFNSNGTRLASGSDDKTIKLWDVTTGKQLATFNGHQNSVLSVAFSPDGSRLASGSADSTVKLWDTTTGKQLAVFMGHQSSVLSVAFSPDGSRLASGSADKTLKLWDLTTGKQWATFNGHQNFVLSVAFNPEGTRFASGSADHTVKLWDVPTGKQLATFGGHQSFVASVAFSQDGMRLASVSVDNTVKLWDVTTGKELTTFGGHQPFALSMAFSPDGTHLAKGAADKTIKVWDVISGKDLAAFNGHQGPVQSVTFSPDGTRLASGSVDKTVKIWDAATGQELALFNGHSASVVSATFSPDGTRLASGSADNTVKLWDIATGKQLITFSRHQSFVFSVTFSPDGTRLASGSADKTVRLWDVITGNQLATFNGHQSSVLSVAFNPDGTHLASGSSDNTIKLWDVATGKELTTFNGHQQSVQSVAFSPDGLRLASGSTDKTVKLWDVATGEELTTFNGHQDFVRSVAFSPDGTCLASSSDDQTVKLWDTAMNENLLWDVAAGKDLATFKGHQRPVLSVAFSPDGTRLASGSTDKTVKLWDVAGGKDLATFNGHQDFVRSVAFNPDGTHLASGSDDKTVKLWDPATGKELTTFTGHQRSVQSVAFNRDGTRLASGSDDTTIKLWDVAAGKDLATFKGHQRPVLSVAFSPDSTHLASGSSDNTVKVWDVATGKELNTFGGHQDFVRSVAFNSDGTRIASASDDHTIKLWDVNVGKELTTLTGHQFFILSVAFSPDGTRIASGSADNTIKLWDVASGKELATFNGHQRYVRSVVFSPDGTRLASGSADTTVKLWDVATGEELATFSGHQSSVRSVAFSLDGSRLVTGSDDRTIKLWDVTANIFRKPNLYAVITGGLGLIDGKETKSTNESSLYSSLPSITVNHREDEVTALAQPGLSPSQADSLRLRLLARTGQWRAARAWWTNGAGPHLPEHRQLYLKLLLTSARSLNTSNQAPVIGEISTVVAKELSPECLGDIGVPLLLSPYVLRMATNSALRSLPAREQLESAVLRIMPRAWQENLGTQAFTLRNSKDTPTDQVPHLDALIRALAKQNPDSAELLRASQAIPPAAP